MPTNRFILALDFDETLTKHDGNITKTWGDRLANAIKRLQRKCPSLGVCILSAATTDHIHEVLVDSGSKELIAVLLSIAMITNTTNNMFFIQTGHNPLIEQVILQNLEEMIAYKKTNYLINKSMETGIPHSHIFLLDDNRHNIRFAKYYGFQTMRVDNQRPTINILKRLEQVENKISGLCLKK